MLKTIFTVDYEIHGNGDGCPYAMMVEPTSRLLRLLDGYGAKLTIMADVAEILRFKEYKEKCGRDDYHYGAIVEQLKHAVATGHDVQLHIHSSYFNAKHENDRWVQDWAEYNFTALSYDRMNWMVKSCKSYLEALLKPVDPTYSCVAFRAANWAVTPSQKVVSVLTNNGINIDTSIFKYGRREGVVPFDYRQAHSSIVPWRVSSDDICKRDDSGLLWELPIYSENRPIWAFLTLGRLHRIVTSLGHKIRKTSIHGPGNESCDETGIPTKTSLVQTLFQRHAWKADFNQCDGNQLIRALKRASDGHSASMTAPLPFVLIGHSKLFTALNERSISPFLAYVADHSNRFGFDTLSGMNQLKGQWQFS